MLRSDDRLIELACFALTIAQACRRAVVRSASAETRIERVAAIDSTIQGLRRQLGLTR